MEHGIEQFAEADLLLVMPFCRRMVYGKAIKVFGGAKSHAS
jgi:hypothetical protein